jgi:hypothetical protein
LVKFPLWKLFYKTEIDLLEDLAAEYRAQGYKVDINKQTNKLSVSKATITYGNTNNSN